MKTKQIVAIIASIPNVAEFSLHKDVNTQRIEQKCREIIKARMFHCQTELLNHLDEAEVALDRQIVHYKKSGGHFSVPTYRELEEALTKPMQEWTKLIWQQIIRQMSTDIDHSTVVFQYATEKLLVM